MRAIEADEACADAPQLQGAWRLRGEVRARLGRRADALANELGRHGGRLGLPLGTWDTNEKMI